MMDAIAAGVALAGVMVAFLAVLWSIFVLKDVGPPPSPPPDRG